MCEINEARPVMHSCSNCAGEPRLLALEREDGACVYYVECRECGRRTNDCWTVDLAIQMWNMGFCRNIDEDEDDEEYEEYNDYTPYEY